MRSWLTGWLPGVLPTSTTSTSAPSASEQAARAEPVGDDDVGSGQQGAAAHGDEVLGAGPAADEGDPADAQRARPRRVPRARTPADGQGAAVEGRRGRRRGPRWRGAGRRRR